MLGLDIRPARTARRAVHRVRVVALDAVRGPARGRVVLTLAAVLGLAGADTGTRREHPDRDTASIVGLVGAAFTIPIGTLADRKRRTRLLAGSMVFWAAAASLRVRSIYATAASHPGRPGQTVPGWRGGKSGAPMSSRDRTWCCGPS